MELIMKNKFNDNVEEEQQTTNIENQITVEDFLKLNAEEMQDFIEDVLSSVEVVIEGMDMTNQLSASEAISYRAIMKLYHALDLTNHWIYNKSDKDNEKEDILGLQIDSDEL